MTCVIENIFSAAATWFLKNFSVGKIQFKVNFRRATFDSKFQRAMAAEAEAAREARAKAIQVSDFAKMVYPDEEGRVHKINS